MLLGEFNHSIDEKGRLIIPAKLRDDLGDSFVICNGLEGCLFVYSQEEWNKFVAELETLPRMNKDARIFNRHSEKQRIWRKTLSWWEYRIVLRSGTRHCGKNAAR